MCYLDHYDHLQTKFSNFHREAKSIFPMSSYDLSLLPSTLTPHHPTFTILTLFLQLSITYRVKAEHHSGWQVEPTVIQPFLATLPHMLGPAIANHCRAHSRGHTFSCLHTVEYPTSSRVCLEASHTCPQHHSHDSSFERLSLELFTLLALPLPLAQGTYQLSWKCQPRYKLLMALSP